MLLGLDRCSSVMRLRLMIRDRIFLWINERSTQILARLRERGNKTDYHQKKITFENRRATGSPEAITGSRPEIRRPIRSLDFTRRFLLTMKFNKSFEENDYLFYIIVAIRL